MIFLHVTTALRQLTRNIGRSILTMLGIIIGIGSVIYIMTMGEAAKQFLLGQITQFGTNVVEVAVQGSFGPFGKNADVRLEDSDVAALEDSRLLPELEAISAGFTTMQSFEVGVTTKTVSVFGDRPDFLEVNNLRVISGRFFSRTDMDARSRVVVLGKGLAEDLFDDAKSAVGERVKIGGTVFPVIGVVDDLPAMGPSGFSPEIVYAPVSTVKELFANPEEQKGLTFVLIEFTPGTDAASFTRRVQHVLRQAHNIEDDEESPFNVVAREQFLDIFDNILIGIQAFVSAVAGISLFVGGIGIMNIMLVTVKERTKEIGLRKAVGAPNSSIFMQFLVESVVLTTVGGVVGILSGLGLSMGSILLVQLLKPSWGVSFVIVPTAIILACGVAMSVGILFGLYPALKASRLSPIESLRYE